MNLLRYKNILITRPIHQANHLKQLIEKNRGNAILFPTLAINPIDFNQENLSQLNIKKPIDYAIFISANAVEHGLPILKHLNNEKHLKLICVGEGSKKALINHQDFHQFETNTILMPNHQFDSEGILQLSELQNIQNKSIIIFKGLGGKKYLAEQLQLRLANVFTYSCYERINPQINDDFILSKNIDAIIISSSEGLMNFWNILSNPSKELLINKPFFVIHKNIYNKSQEIGLNQVMITETSDEGILKALLNYFK